MLTYALLILASAALGGFVLASGVLRGKLAPWVISVAHGLLGLSGVVVLVLVVLQGAAPARVTAALALVVAAALGGLYLASMHLRGQLAPRTIVYVHAAAAILGVLTLTSVVLA